MQLLLYNILLWWINIMGLVSKFNILGVQTLSNLTWELDEMPNDLDVNAIQWFINGQPIIPILDNGVFSYKIEHKANEYNITAVLTDSNYIIS